MLIGPDDGRTSGRNGHTGNLGQFEARLLRLLAPSSNLPSDEGAVAGSSSPVPTPASPDPAALAAAAALDPLATSNILGLFWLLLYSVLQSVLQMMQIYPLCIVFKHFIQSF